MGDFTNSIEVGWHVCYQPRLDGVASFDALAAALASKSKRPPDVGCRDPVRYPHPDLPPLGEGEKLTPL